ncbi:OmpA/MotB domain protein [uncultured Paludibacter sp.]|uniref:OmpA/MotB domain protein n=1 Tax=uncultured Paludibacter sp. TaxID=497635 RepID=A0A653ACL0_9BACT|nr:OmpA/MotB domain protein [uncultured Paludibacter sp.]
MRLKSLLLGIILPLSLSMSGQNADNRNALGLYVTKSEYKGDLGNSLWQLKKGEYHYNWGGTINYQRFLNRSFDWGLQGGYGEYDFVNPSNTTLKFTGKKYDASTYFNYKLNNGYLLPEKSFIAPFLTAGIGGAGYRSGTINKNPMFDFTVPVGAGIKLRFSDVFAVEYKYLYNFTSQDTRDNNTAAGKNDFLGFKTDAYGQHFVGLVFSFGSKDTDKDGVKDKKDLCPDTPFGVAVDANGCPIDTDGDGVADYLDKCPTVAGLTQFNGCPDTDGDGVEDAMDKCPDTPSGVKVNASGCPVDTDNDGIPDYKDKCPTVAGIAAFEGCPDTDGDGIQDALDKCPTVAGLAQFEGCPDSDGDGVPDNLDKCPTIAGIAANKGCPEVQKEVITIFKQALQGIQFDVNKATIKPISYDILDKVVKVMNDNPAYNLEINGHTDSQGSDEYNQKLSEERAASVKQYLVDKGIDAARLTTQGFGETQPVASNKTSTGRFLNRRVEFKILF